MVNGKATNEEKIALYMELTPAIVTLEPGKWEISTPEETISFGSYRELMEDVQNNIEIMFNIYAENNELDEWNAAVERATGNVDGLPA